MESRPILLVDDDESFLRAVSRALSRNGFRVVSTTSARAALDAAGREVAWSAFLLDLCLPDADADGLTLLSRLRERWPGVRAAVLTGVEDFAVARSAATLGAVYIPKVDVPSVVSLLELVRPPSADALERLRRAASRLGFTPRELAVVECIAQGRDVDAFCAEQGIKRRTFRHHSAAALRKARAPNIHAFLVSLAYGSAPSASADEERE